MSANILVVDDEPTMLRYMQTLLEADSYRVTTASSGAEAIERVQKKPVPDVVLLDMVMPGLDGLQTLAQLRQTNPDLKVVMLSCVSDTRKVVEAIHLGARNYCTKPFQRQELDSILTQCLSSTSASDTSVPGTVEELDDDLFFLAVAPAMRKIRTQAALVANVDVPVLILGESGTGKENVARLIHKISARGHRTFLKVNCAALPSELLESELFGYEPGAFTGATRAKPGKFELCNKGTLLLDEIGEMSTGLQSKLLHVLQDQEFSRLGGRVSIKVDVRILAATNIEIQQAIATKRLREDLYYRLNAFTLHVPPLRERREEIPLLLKHFMIQLSARFARAPLPLSPKLLDLCQRYSWPGNVRQLENFVKRYLVLGDESWAISELQTNMGEEGVSREAQVPPSKDPGDLKMLVRGVKGQAEIEAIARSLEQTNWNRKETARLLGISYKALLYKIRQYQIEPAREQALRGQRADTRAAAN